MSSKNRDPQTRVGIDTGGTFTDIVLADGGGDIHRRKLLDFGCHQRRGGRVDMDGVDVSAVNLAHGFPQALRVFA